MAYTIAIIEDEENIAQGIVRLINDSSLISFQNMIA